MDVHSPKIRSYNMSRITGRDTKPEMIVRRGLHKMGFRFTTNSANNKKLPGKPDLVLPKYNLCIFVHGCFWHAHSDCKYFKLPMTRQKWWKEKLDKNVMRDREAVKTLHEIGWRVFVVWECALKVQKHVPETLISLSKNIPKRETDLLQYTGTDKLTCRQNPISFG